MSKTCFTIAEQKQNVINFIKKHYDILCLDYGSNAITTEYLDKLKNANNADFFRRANNVRLKFGSNFYIFSDNYDEKHHMLAIWLPTSLSKVASDKAIKEFCSSKSFEEAVEDCYCSWYNMTPKRWETFEAIFDFYDKPKTAKTAKTAKKTTKKVVKKTTKKVVKKTTKKTAKTAKTAKKTAKTAKKTTKKTSYKTSDKAKALTLDDFKLFLNDIVFID